jgi:nitrous oxidase accessory protein
MILLLLPLLVAQADTLRLGPGVHPGPLVLSRPTVVLGAPGAILRGNGRGSVLRIEAAGSVVRSLRIEQSGRNSDTDDAGVLVLADSVELERLVIRDVLYGVYLKNVRDVVLRGLDIEGPAGLAESQMGDGIHFFHSRRVTALGNRISHVRDGMYFAYSDSIVALENQVTQVRFGLHYMFSHQNRFERNRFSGNAAGAVLMNSNGLVVRGNIFAWNRGSRSYGLVLQTTTNALVENNTVVGNGIGIFLDNAIHARVTGNQVAGNWLALQLFPNSEATRLTGNSIESNTFDAAGGWAEGAYLLCEKGRGNYWSAAKRTGYDLEGDGVLDAPYGASSPLAEMARDREQLRLFTASPAARVIEWAERTFPVFDVAQITDPCPLAAPSGHTPDAHLAFGSPANTRSRITQGGVALLAVAGGVLLLGTGATKRSSP